jgi:predicted RNase H-like HicB family nuclease
VINVNRYPAQVFWSAEDEGFIAIAPDLPGCSAFGDSQQEALAELQDAIAAWIEAAQSAGNPVPSPSDPARRPEYSGKVLLRMPRELHGRLASQAKSQNVSLNHYAVYLLTLGSTQHSIEGSVHVAGINAGGGAFWAGPTSPVGAGTFCIVGPTLLDAGIGNVVSNWTGIGAVLSAEQMRYTTSNVVRTVMASTTDEIEFVQRPRIGNFVSLKAGARDG